MSENKDLFGVSLFGENDREAADKKSAADILARHIAEKNWATIHNPQRIAPGNIAKIKTGGPRMTVLEVYESWQTEERVLMAKVAWGDYNYLRPGEGVEGWVLNQLKLPISCLIKETEHPTHNWLER